ncbi:hypothetical protein BHE74_00025757 [Ensete ventricosum]|nr:hypothetical protein GW17_00022720 [Ensete ventricosum]RWW66858.1 hypothetical protein BHE74_00025757 [Ensete ventricosum]
MAQSKDDIKYGAAQAKLSDDEMLRVGYKHGTPLESGKISDAEPVDLFVDARRISEATKNARPAEDDPNSGGLSLATGSVPILTERVGCEEVGLEKGQRRTLFPLALPRDQRSREPRNPKEKSGCKRAQEKPNLLPYSPQKKMSSSAPLPFLGCIS